MAIDSCQLRFKNDRPLFGADQDVMLVKSKRSSRVSWRITSAAAYGLTPVGGDQPARRFGEGKVVAVCVEFKLADADAMTGPLVAWTEIEP